MSIGTINFENANINTREITISDRVNVDSGTFVVNGQTNRVGIGSSNPQNTLDIVGDIAITGDVYQSGTVVVSSQWTQSGDDIEYTTGNVFTSNVYIAGGLISNTGGTRKKTYSYTGTLATGTTQANATMNIVFSNHVFYAKIHATLVEGDATVSSFVQECTGGSLSGVTPNAITLGATSVIGHSAYPWSTVVAAGTNDVTFKPDQDLDPTSSGSYNIFVEYFSSHANGKVESFGVNLSNSPVIEFGY
jgi:hypothetical protein